MTRRLLALAFLLAASVAMAPAASAGDAVWDCEKLDPDAMDNLGWRGALSGPDAVEAGTSASFRVDVSILPDHVLYRERADVALPEGASGVSLGQPVYPPTKRRFDKIFKKDVDYWDAATVSIEAPVTFGGKPGPRTLELVVTQQACNPCLCLFPAPVTLTKTLTVTAPKKAAVVVPVPPAATAAGTPAPAPTAAALALPAAAGTPAALSESPAADRPSPSGSVFSSQSRMAELIASNFLLALLVAFAGGVLISLTPCVYPMIPITIAVIGNQATAGGASASQSRSRGFFLSLVYVAGITLVYATLGVVAAKSGKEFGFALRNPWVLLSVATVFLALAASMFGAWSLQLPAALQTRLASYQGSGLAGVFVTGLFAGVVAGPCTAPVLVGILIGISTGSVGAGGGFALMTAFSLGMGLLFVALGTFSGLLTALPRSGAWMETVKQVFGVLLVAAALYFVELAVPAWMFALALGASLVMLGVILGAATRLDAGAPFGRRVSQGAGWLAAAAGLWFFLGGLGESGWGPARPLTGLGGMPPGVGPSDRATADLLPWIPDEAEGRRKSAQSGKPMLIDFYADDCAACKELDEYTYTDARVIDEVTTAFVPVKVDLTVRLDTPAERKKVIQDLRTKYRVLGLPKVSFVRPDGTVMDDRELTLYGFEEADAFLRRVERAKSCRPAATSC